MEITTHEATVNTATVEVQTLKISGRQVTLAVFRQLLSEDVIDYETAEVLGVMWGTVNYHPDKCSDDGNHVHVVWERNGLLRRARINRYEYRLAWASRDDLQEAKKQLFITECEQQARRWLKGDRSEDVIAVPPYNPSRRTLVLPKWPNGLPPAPWDGYALSYIENDRESEDRFVRDLRGRLRISADVDLDVLHGELRIRQGQLSRNITEADRRYKAVRLAVDGLPQLFIAT